MNLEYFYDDAGNITRLNDYLDSDKTRTYQYDDVDRLIEADSLSYVGEILTNSISNVTDYLYTGKEWDAETGLYYYGARYYDPKLARFISADTIVPEPFYPQSFNRYSYTVNNPIVLRDLDGHCYSGISVAYNTSVASNSAPSSYGPSTPSGHGNSGGSHVYTGIAVSKNIAENNADIGNTTGKDTTSSAEPHGGGNQGQSNQTIPVHDANLPGNTGKVADGLVVDKGNIVGWVYSILTGGLSYIDTETGNETQFGTGYSGHGEGLNNPDMQDVRNVGPIPEGTYKIGPQQDYVRSNGKTLTGAMTLTPQNGTNTFGRTGFLIHGGNFRTMDSSTGCIILPPGVRNQIGSSSEKSLRVTR